MRLCNNEKMGENAVSETVSLFSVLSDIPDDDTKRVEKQILDLVDVVILNNLDSINISISMRRRLPASSLIKLTPYDKFGVINYNRLEKAIINSLSGLSGRIIISINQRDNLTRHYSCSIDSTIELELMAKPTNAYRKERIHYYGDTVFKQKLLREHRQLMEKMCSRVCWLTSMGVFPQGVFYYSDCLENGIYFSDFEMADIVDNSKRYQMASALMEILNQKGHLYEGPRASSYGSVIVFDLIKVSTTVSSKELKQW